MDRTDDVIAEIFLKIFSKNGERETRDRSGGGGAAFFIGVSLSPSHTPPRPLQ